MELLDRGLQRQVLQRLADDYPTTVDAGYLGEIAPGNSLAVNIAYLEEHRLVIAKWAGARNAGAPLMSAEITKSGMDFLADDGGLSAILGVVTVQLHEDTLKELVAEKIRTAELPESERQRFLASLRELPGEATKHLVLRLLDAGLANWHQALPVLRNSLGL